MTLFEARVWTEEASPANPSPRTFFLIARNPRKHYLRALRDAFATAGHPVALPDASGNFDSASSCVSACEVRIIECFARGSVPYVFILSESSVELLPLELLALVALVRQRLDAEALDIVFVFPIDVKDGDLRRMLDRVRKALQVIVLENSADFSSFLSSMGEFETKWQKSTPTLEFHDRNDPFYDFSTFAPATLRIDEQNWPTAEHFYQASKFKHHLTQRIVADNYASVFLGQTIHGLIKTATRPSTARHLAHLFSERADRAFYIEGASITAMRTAIRAKFEQHTHLGNKLLSTRRQRLVHGSPADAFWGAGRDGEGQNWLGRLLVEQRARMFDSWNQQCAEERGISNSVDSL